MPCDLPNWLENKIIPEPMSGCWIWIGATDTDGYGWVKLGRLNGQQSNAPAHRLVYEFYNGPVSAELDLDHLCRFPPCVNPDHQEPVTPKINNMRGQSPSARNARKLFCDNGHTLADAYIVNSNRKCRTCQLDNMARYYRKRKNQ